MALAEQSSLNSTQDSFTVLRLYVFLHKHLKQKPEFHVSAPEVWV